MFLCLDLKRQYATLKTDLDAAVLNVMAHGRFINGPEVKAFEGEATASSARATPSASPRAPTRCFSPCARSASGRATR